MKPRHKNLAASALLLALFAIPAGHLASENRKLAAQLDKLKTPASGDDNQHGLSQRTLSSREMTVGRLFQQGPGIKDARSLAMTWSLARRNHHFFGFSKLQYQLNQMTMAELRALRADLRRLPGYGDLNLQYLESMLSVAQIAIAPDDPVAFFDRIIKEARIDQQLSKKLQNWATSDPEAAIAWFQSKTEASDFHNGSMTDRKNRALVLKSLLAGVATQDLALAVELFSNETRRFELLEAGSAVIPLAMEHAVAQEDDSLFRQVMEVAVIEAGVFGIGEGHPWFDFAKATGDLSRTVEILESLESLENQHDYGQNMSAIILSQNESSFREKMNWLNERVPEREDRIRALQGPILAELNSGARESQPELLNEILTQPQGENRDLEIVAAIKALDSYAQRESAQSLLGEISNPDLRAQVEADRSFDPFAAAE